MWHRACICAFLLMAAPAMPAEAAASLAGRSGLINIPTAYVLRPAHGAAGYFYLSGSQAFAGNIALSKGVEIGYSRWRPEYGKDYDIYSAKVVLLEERVLKPALAVGVDDWNDRIDRSYYLAASKQGPWGVRIHLGLKSGDTNGLFYGVEKEIRLNKDWRKKLPFIPVFNLVLEYDGRHLNYGAYIRNNLGLRLDIGWRDGGFYGGLQMCF